MPQACAPCLAKLGAIAQIRPWPERSGRAELPQSRAHAALPGSTSAGLAWMGVYYGWGWVGLGSDSGLWWGGGFFLEPDMTKLRMASDANMSESNNERPLLLPYRPVVRFGLDLLKGYD